jgi:hypothetical protein
MEPRPFESVRDIVTSLAVYLPTLLAGLLVLVIGLLVAWAAARLFVRVLIFMRLDRVMARLRWTSALDSGDARHSLFELLGTVLGVFVFLIFLANALVIWHLTVLSDLFTRLLLLIPELFTVALILIVGWSLANLVSRAVQRVLYREHFARARLVATLVRWAVLVTAFASALVELKIAVTIVTGAFLIAFGALALCLVLAVGLGSKRGVELLWEEQFRRSAEAEEVDDEADEGRSRA